MKVECSEDFVKNIIEYLCLELDYHVYETSDPNGYAFEVDTELRLLTQFGEYKLAESYRKDYEERVAELAEL